MPLEAQRHHHLAIDARRFVLAGRAPLDRFEHAIALGRFRPGGVVPGITVRRPLEEGAKATVDVGRARHACGVQPLDPVSGGLRARRHEQHAFYVAQGAGLPVELVDRRRATDAHHHQLVADRPNAHRLCGAEDPHRAIVVDRAGRVSAAKASDREPTASSPSSRARWPPGRDGSRESCSGLRESRAHDKADTARHSAGAAMTEPTRIATEPRRTETEPQRLTREPRRPGSGPRRLTGEPPQTATEPRRLSTGRTCLALPGPRRCAPRTRDTACACGWSRR